MKMVIEKAEQKDIDEIKQMYDRVTAYLEENINYPAWRSGVYPTRKTAEEAVEKGSLYAARISGCIAAAVILKEEAEPEFKNAAWLIQAGGNEIFSLCTLAVDPKYLRQGIARKLVQFSLELAEKKAKKAIRLDVTQVNEPAIRLYREFGFQYIGTVDEGAEYEAVYGQRLFDLYEKAIEGRA